MNPSSIQILDCGLFIIAISHTFLANRIHRFALHFPRKSIRRKLLHFFGEVEIVFGIWAFVFLFLFALIDQPQAALKYLETRHFAEPTFVFVILSICATRPILNMAEFIIKKASALFFFIPYRSHVFFVSALTIGPILGSFITEPAAMTVTAMLLLEHLYSQKISTKFRYATLGLLFVNVSIGGTLTPYAAPPILMVASKWGWGLDTMFIQFGWKGSLACLLSSTIIAFQFRKELKRLKVNLTTSKRETPIWVQGVYLLFLCLTVIAAQHTVIVLGLFVLFLAFVGVTTEYQKAPLRLKDGLFVAFFLAGLIVLGGMQDWWLEPILKGLSRWPLYLGTIVLTAITDNAALTYLGSLVPSLSEVARYSLVAGAVVGGGLTLIANAPNLAGYRILQDEFGEDGINALDLLLAALLPTIIAGLCFAIR